MNTKSKFFIGFLLMWVLGFQSQAQPSFTSHKEEGELSSTTIEVAVTESGARIVSTFQEGLAITKLGNKYGFVNQQGYEICLPKFDRIKFFKGGYAAVQLGNKWSFLNKQGKKITAFRFDWVASFENGAAAVQINGKWGFINEQGINIVAATYDQVINFDENGIAKARKNQQWFTVSATGETKPINSAWSTPKADNRARL